MPIVTSWKAGWGAIEITFAEDGTITPESVAERIADAAGTTFWAHTGEEQLDITNADCVLRWLIEVLFGGRFPHVWEQKLAIYDEPSVIS